MSGNFLSKFVAFAFGAAVGSVATWKLVEAKYRQIADEEIESVREVYAKVYGDSTEETEDEDEEDQKIFDDLVKDLGYSSDEDEKKDTKKDTKKEAKIESEGEEDADDMVRPYVIEEEDFDDIGYETESLYYYDDGVLIYSITEEVINNIDELVGEDSIKQLLDSGEDYIYVRNDELGIDFEILRDRRNFSEVD